MPEVAVPDRERPMLRCGACGADAGRHARQYCERCWGPLEIVHPIAALAAGVDRGTIEAGPQSMWRYGPLLAVPEPSGGAASVGWTPLRPAGGLGRAIGCPELWLKDETVSPSGSFKDRLVATALTAGRDEGARVALAASTGNLARSVVRHASSFGMAPVVLVPAGSAPALGGGSGAVVAVAAPYDAVNRLSVELAELHADWASVNVGLRPYYVEGARTLAFEIAEQLGWTLPDVVVVPIASGASLVQVHRAFEMLVAVGLVEGPTPRMVAAQPAGCAPVAGAFADGRSTVDPVRPDTVVESLAMGDPPDGDEVLRVVRATGGWADAPTDDEAIAAVRLLTDHEAIEADLAVGVALAAVPRGLAGGRLDPGERTVVLATGRSPMVGRQSPAAQVVAPELDAVGAVIAAALAEGPRAVG